MKKSLRERVTFALRGEHRYRLMEPRDMRILFEMGGMPPHEESEKWFTSRLLHPESVPIIIDERGEIRGIARLDRGWNFFDMGAIRINIFIASQYRRKQEATKTLLDITHMMRKSYTARVPHFIAHPQDVPAVKTFKKAEFLQYNNKGWYRHPMAGDWIRDVNYDRFL